MPPRRKRTAAAASKLVDGGSADSGYGGGSSGASNAKIPKLENRNLLQSKIHQASPIAVSSELNLFLVPYTNLSVERQYTVKYLPLSTLDGSRTFDIKIPASPDFVDCTQILLYVEYSIDSADGAAWKTDTSGTNTADQIRTTIIPMHALWSEIGLSLNETRITDQYGTYPYRAFFNHLIYTADKPRQTFLASEGVVQGYDGEQYIDKTKTIVHYGVLQLDLCDCETALLSNVNMHLKLQRSKDNFAVYNKGNQTSDFEIKITQLFVSVRKYSLNPGIAIGIEQALLVSSAKYAHVRKVVVAYNIPAGQAIVQIDNALMGIIPKRVVCGLIENEAVNGSGLYNPFRFKHFNVNTLCLYINGAKYPNGEGYKQDYNDVKKCAYEQTFRNLFTELTQDTNVVTLDVKKAEFKDAKCLYAFNLSPIYSNAGIHSGATTLQSSGSLRFEIGFGITPTKALQLVTYAEYDSILQIDRNRGITTNW